MSYDPFARGRNPVGVRTMEHLDGERASRSLPIELWYPARVEYRGQDLDDATRDRFEIGPGLPAGAQNAVRDAKPAAGAYPLFMYFHGGYGHRRECAQLCTHLASHGYVVGAPSFAGDNIADLIPTDGGSTAVIAHTPIDESARRRPGQAASYLDRVLSIRLSADLALDTSKIGTGGFSMGGYTSLALNSLDRRPAATFAMCPMFGERSLVPQVRRLQNLLHVDDWERPVPTCVLSGQLDPFVNAEDMRLLYEKLPQPKRLVLLARAGHLHWADGAAAVHEMFRQGYLSGAFPDPEIDAIALGTAMRPFSELSSEQQSGDASRGLCVAHLDAWLKDDARARAFLDHDLAGTFAARGIEADVRI